MIVFLLFDFSGSWPGPNFHLVPVVIGRVGGVAGVVVGTSFPRFTDTFPKLKEKIGRIKVRVRIKKD